MNEDILKFLNNQYDIMVEERNAKIKVPTRSSEDLLRNPFSNTEMSKNLNQPNVGVERQHRKITRRSFLQGSEEQY